MIESLLLIQEQLLNLNNLFILIGLLLVFSELFIGIDSGFDLVLIGSILILSGFTGVAFSNIWIAVIAAITLSIIYFIYGRKIIKQKIFTSPKKTNIDKLIDKTAIVTKKITPHHPGQVKIADEHWRAKSTQTIEPRSEVTIASIEGVTVSVKKI